MTIKTSIKQIISALALIGFTLLTLVACTTQQSTATAEPKNTYWKLIRVADNDIPSDDNPRHAHILLNDDNRVSGSDGCNRLMGSYSLNANQLNFGQLASTRMACLQGGDYAQAFTDALTKTRRFTITANQLQLIDANNYVVAEFVKAEAASSTAE